MRRNYDRLENDLGQLEMILYGELANSSVLLLERGTILKICRRFKKRDTHVDVVSKMIRTISGCGRWRETKLRFVPNSVLAATL